MKNVSQQFKEMITTPGKQQKLLVLKGEEEISVESVRITSDGDLFTTVMKTCSIESNDSGLLSDQELNVLWGLKKNEDIEYLDFGNFIVKESTDDRNTNKYSLKAYDYMIKFMSEYKGVGIDYPCTLKDYLMEICNYHSINLLNEDFFNDDLIIPYDYFAGLNITYRDVLDQIAEVTCSTIIIKDNSLFLKNLTETNEVLSAKILKEVTIEELFKPLNSFVLARSPQVGDDVYRPTEEPEELSELAFVNNEFLNYRRDEIIDKFYQHLLGMTFWTFSCEELGAGYFEPGDLVITKDREGNTFECLITSTDFEITDGTKEKLSSKMPEQSTTRYKYATTIEKTIKNTQIIVDKQENTITSIAHSQEGLISQLTSLVQNIEGFMIDVRATSGINAFFNSVGLNETEFWNVETETGQSIGVQDEYVVNNTTSRSAFRISNAKQSQSIKTIVGHRYALTFKYRKTIARGYVNWIDNNTVTLIDSIVANSNYVEFSRVFIAQSNEITFEFGSDGYYLEISDLVCKHLELRPGDVIENVSVPWSPNPNEIYGSNVFIDLNGVTINEITSSLKNVLNSQGMTIFNTLNGNVLLEVKNNRTFIDYMQSNKVKIGNTIMETTDDGWYAESIGGNN